MATSNFEKLYKQAQHSMRRPSAEEGVPPLSAVRVDVKVGMDVKIGGAAAGGATAAAQCHTPPPGAFRPVKRNSKDLNGEKEGPEYSTEDEVRLAIQDRHIGYYLANGKYLRLHEKAGLFANRTWKPGTPNETVEKVWAYKAEGWK